MPKPRRHLLLDGLLLPFELRLQLRSRERVPAGLLLSLRVEGRLQGKSPSPLLLLDGLLLPFELRLQLRSRKRVPSGLLLCRNRLGLVCCGSSRSSQPRCRLLNRLEGSSHLGMRALLLFRIVDCLEASRLHLVYGGTASLERRQGHRQVWPEAAVLCVVTMGRMRE